ARKRPQEERAKARDLSQRLAATVAPQTGAEVKDGVLVRPEAGQTVTFDALGMQTPRRNLELAEVDHGKVKNGLLRHVGSGSAVLLQHSEHATARRGTNALRVVRVFAAAGENLVQCAQRVVFNLAN